MSSTNSPIKTRHESKVLSRSASFKKLCSVPYNFKIEALQSYQEHIKTVINLLKIATRRYVISVYLKFASVILFNHYAFALWNLLKISCLATVVNDSKTTKTSCVGGSIACSNFVLGEKPHLKSITWGLLKIPIVAIQTLTTYVCIIYVGFQIVWLANALFWSSSIPFGLIFLVIDLVYMGFIILKIALNDANCTSQTVS